MPKKKNNRNGGGVGEEVRIAVNLALKKFHVTEESKELEFPSSLTSDERAYIHQLALQLGLRSKSRGKGPTRYVTVYKREGSTIVQADAFFQLVRNSRQYVYSLLSKYPLTNKERQELLPLTERDRLLAPDTVKEVNKAVGRLNMGIPQVPYPPCSSELMSFRQTLPIWPMRDEIVRQINSNQVVIITGETGSGKTTQVPQYIMDHFHSIGKPCRIICTQPRRLSAVSVSERVAVERDEKLGQSIGYQIRLESRVSPKTVLTYCTNGVLLRSLMGGDSSLATVTHIIVDEVHERDRFSDFLLIVLRDSLAKFRNLRLVLMSASIDPQVFVKYFHGCPVITVPGRLYEVKEVFLEDIIKFTGYMSKEMLKVKTQMEKKKEQKQKLESWTKCLNEKSPEENNNKVERRVIPAPILGQYSEPIPEKTELEPWLVEDMDRCLEDAWVTGSEDAFAQLLHLVLSENVSVDYQHSDTSVTPLMVAVIRGSTNTVEQLLTLGANCNVQASNDFTAYDFAKQMNKKEMMEIMEAYMNTHNTKVSNDTELLSNENELGDEEKELLDIYHHSFNDENIDMNLLMNLLSQIHSSQEKGAILVFLPGYDDIITLRDLILSEEKKLSDFYKISLFILHSNIQTCDQKKVFRPALPGTRKIILATNIAETSITVDDVVFVIDSGKVRERSYDAVTSICMLKTGWVSKSCAQQRRGRAGRTRPGVCYRIYSRLRYNAMEQYQTPEILRVPLQDLCLHTKLLAPSNTPIADFLARAMEPPSFLITRNAVQLLKTIDALDPWEDLTELGHHLLDLPIEPRLGKMLLYSVVLKCLDPVLTIVCCIAHKDPFVLPSQPSQKRAAQSSRKKFAAGTYSDHMALLRAFQTWQHARGNGWERSFCEKHFISAATMEMVVGMRTQLLGQLRASGFVRARGGGDIRDLNSNSENWAVVKAALCAGLYPNLIRVDREHMQLRTQKESKVSLHPSSALRECLKTPRTTMAAAHTQTVENLPSDWLVYEEMSRNGRISHVRCCTLVTPITVVIFAGPARLPLDAVSEADGYRGEGYVETESDSEVEEKSDGQNTTLKVDDWVVFRVDAEAAHLALQLRQKWHSLFLRRMKTPTKLWNQIDDTVIKTIISVLTAEEQSLGLQQPSGIGQRPRPMSNDSNGSNGSHTGMRKNDDTEASDDSSISNSENQLRFMMRPQRKFSDSSPKKLEQDLSKQPMTNAERSDTSSNKSYGSGNMIPCPSPTPSQASSNDTRSNNGLPISTGTSYYVIKASSQKAVEASLSRGLWAFTPTTERKLLKAQKNKQGGFRSESNGDAKHSGGRRGRGGIGWCLIGKDGKTVILVFSVQGSGHFQGYAKFVGDIGVTGERCPELTAPNLSLPRQIEWIKRANIPFQATRHLLNPLNENRRVQTSRDGQEIEANVGEALCNLWDKIPPFVPKSVLFNQLKASEHDSPLGRNFSYERPNADHSPSHPYHGRPIRGYSYMGFGGGYAAYPNQNSPLGFGPRSQHPK